MVTRRARPVFWPAKLLWFPLLAAGLPLMLHLDMGQERVSSGTWRVVLNLPKPETWVAHPATFWPGVVLILLSAVLFGLYLRHARPGRWTATEHGGFAVAAWLLFAVALLSTFQLDRHAATFGEYGLDWRFLAHLRTTWVDRLTLGISLAGAVTCWVLSWGFAPVRPYRDAAAFRPSVE